MSVQSEISRISGNVAAALAAIAEKGVSVPSGSKSDALASLIASIEAGGGGGRVVYGTHTPAQQRDFVNGDTTPYLIEHGLGVVPDFVVFTRDMAPTTTYNVVCGFYVRNKIDSYNQETGTSLGTSNYATTLKGYPTSPKTMLGGGDYGCKADETNIQILAGAQMKILSGRRLTWIAGVVK